MIRRESLFPNNNNNNNDKMTKYCMKSQMKCIPINIALIVGLMIMVALNASSGTISVSGWFEECDGSFSDQSYECSGPNELGQCLGEECEIQTYRACCRTTLWPLYCDSDTCDEETSTPYAWCVMNGSGTACICLG